MSGLLDEQYLTWLYSQVSSVKAKNPTRTYWSLLRQLYTKEFVWFVPNDDNRVEDGRDLRYEFIESQRIEVAERDWLNLGCSVLEMLMGLSRRLSFEAGGESREWFWHLIDNLGFINCTDAWYKNSKHNEAVDDKLERLIFRTYDYDGADGGLFPLSHPEEDQRNVEIWYQLSAYILERE